MRMKQKKAEKLNMLLKNIKYFAQELDDLYFEEEEHKQCVNALLNKSETCIHFDVNIGEDLEKRIVVFWFDRSQSKTILDDIKKRINDRIEKPFRKVQLVGLVEHLDEKMILSSLIKDGKISLCKEIKCSRQNFTFDVVFMPEADKEPIELKVARVNSLLFPEPNTNLNVMSDTEKKEETTIGGYVFVVSLSELVDIYNKVGDELFASNLRYGINDKMSLEDSMKDTLFEEPGMFWYYNNGITIVTSSDDIELESAGKVILARQWNDNGLNFSVINGAQTISTASRIFYGSGNDKDKVKKAKDEAKVLLRIITAEDEHTKRNITIALNRQKPIKSEDIAFQTGFISAFNDYMTARERAKKDYLYIIKRGAPVYDENTIELPLFAQLVYSCLMNPTDARNVGPSGLYYENGSEKLNTKYFLEEFALSSSSTKRDFIYAKYYKAIIWANKVYAEFNKALKKVDNKDDKIILANNRWSFVSYVLKSIQNFSGQELDVDYSDFEIRDDVITSIRKYMEGFVSLVNSTYGPDEKYKTDDSKGDSFWNNLISAEPNELFTLLQKKKDGVLTTGEFEEYLLDHSFSYDDQTKQYVAEVDSDIFTDVIIRVGDATFDIYATILNVYSDVNEEDGSDKEKYEKLKEKVVEEFQGKTVPIPQIGKDDSKEDDSDYIMFKGNPFDTNLVSVVYDLLSKKYIEE
jgi:hypothetical protein